MRVKKEIEKRIMRIGRIVKKVDRAYCFSSSQLRVLRGEIHNPKFRDTDRNKIKIAVYEGLNRARHEAVVSQNITLLGLMVMDYDFNSPVRSFLGGTLITIDMYSTWVSYRFVSKYESLL